MLIIVTLKDIANACGVSVSTVSRAFDRTSRISQPVRQRILTCASELGYSPNLIARSLKNNRSMTIALIIPSIENRFYIDVLHHLEIKLHQYGYRLLVTFIHKGIATERDCLELAASAQVDGIIFFPRHRENQQYIESLMNQIKIIQLFTSPYPAIDSVVMNDEGGAEAGTNYLLQHGHQRIVYTGDTSRIAGFWRAIDDAHISHENVLVLPEITTDEFCNVIESFRPTAIFSIASTTEIVWSATRELGLSIPDEISIIAYDDSDFVNLVGLTAVAHNLEEIAIVLVEQLLSRLNGDSSTPPRHLTLESFIVERKSVLKV